MRNSMPIWLLIPTFVLFIISSACAFSFDLGGLPEAVDSTPSAEPAAPTPAPTGSISGKLSYPSEFIPPLRVVAFRVENGIWTQYYSYVDTNLNASDYQIDGLQPGLYWITAYTISDENGVPVGLAGGYSQAVLCGLDAECTDHSLVAVEVKPGQVTGGADPGDWYAPEGSFLPNPAP